MPTIRRLFLSLCVAVMLFAAVGRSPLQAQGTAGNSVILSLSVPQFSDEVFSAQFISDYESAHPGVKLNLVKQTPTIPAAAQSLDKHFEEVQKYVQSADVLYVSGESISAEATRAGYYLDLMPLANEDKTLNPDDFFPSIWQSFQWDKGLWAMPFSADAFVLSYNPDAFDKAGISYPNDKWTIDDLSYAVRKLAVKGADGKVTTPGIDVTPGILPYLLRGMLSESLFDSTTIPNTPKFATPETAALLDAWYKLDTEGLVGQEFGKAPLAVVPAIVIALQPATSPGEKRAGALLPGGKATISVQGFAVSAGTQHPEQAYALAQWLTTRGDIANNGFASTPARKSLLGKVGDNTPFQLNVSPEVKALIERAIANAIPLSELRFVDYLSAAYAKMKSDKIDAQTALQTAEADAVKAQANAADKKSKVIGSLTVATPIPGAVGGKVTLKFGINTFSNPLPNKDQWDKAVADFVASDPQVGAVALEATLDTLPKVATKYDCFYLSYNAVPGSQIDSVLSLDPYLSADSTFDKADMVGNVMAQVQRANTTWALPLDIQPNVLKYDPDQFAKAGLAEPTDVMTVDAFKDALKQLKPTAQDPAPFVPFNTSGSYVLSLAAAYGGLPIDYRTNPMTINFSDPKTVDAVRQVLDLAKQGYIKYKPLGGTQFDITPFPDNGIMVQSSLGAFAFTLPGFGVSKDDKHKFMLYPKGMQFAAVTYGMGTGYISATSQNPDSCYRFLSAISRNVYLFSSMPARRSLVNDPALATAQNPNIVALYKQIDTLLQDPTTVAIPSINLISSDFASNQLYYLWLNRAFDAYVLKDGDLEASLKDAEMQSKTFQDCTANQPPLDTSTPEKQKQWLKGFKECAIKADPTLKPMLDLIKTE